MTLTFARLLPLAAVCTLYFSHPSSTFAAPPTVVQKILPDGLTVLVAEDHSLPLTTVEIGVKNGAMTESPEWNGLSHLYEHMFFKANSVIPDQLVYMARMRELGMVWNGTTSDERVNYFFTTTTDHFKEAMVFMRDAITSPLFDEKDLSRERVVVTGEIDRNEANPFYHFFHQLDQKLFWKYPTRKDALGTRKTVLGATPEMMKTIESRYYVPNNSVLIVTGDVKPEEVFALAEQLYVKWAATEDPFVKYPLVQHPPLPHSELVLVEQPVDTVSISFNWIGPSAVGPDQDLGYAIDRMALALREPSSQFQKSLVDSGACVSASFHWETARNAGAVRLSAEARPDKIDECAKALFGELSKMKAADYLSDEELANADHRAEVDKERERERPSQFAHVLSEAWCVTGLPYYDSYIARLKHATRADMGRFLDQFVLGKPFVMGIMESKAQREKGSDKAHFEKLFDIPAARGAK